VLDEELKKILVCPKCRGEVEIHEEVQEIHCAACQVIYAIDDDVPVMLIDEAKPLSGSRLRQQR
jgi:uncharacterized protein YbaR (Trm112 family)